MRRHLRAAAHLVRRFRPDPWRLAAAAAPHDPGLLLRLQAAQLGAAPRRDPRAALPPRVR